MLSVDQAVDTLLADTACGIGVEVVSLRDALGRTLAIDLFAAIDVPPADNSAMGGYALRHADWADPV
jgi:molybdopterin molybdotransferase